MEPKLIRLTASLWTAINAARGDRSQAELIEELLWRTKPIRDTGIERTPRRRAGRPPQKKPRTE